MPKRIPSPRGLVPQELPSPLSISHTALPGCARGARLPSRRPSPQSHPPIDSLIGLQPGGLLDNDSKKAVELTEDDHPSHPWPTEPETSPASQPTIAAERFSKDTTRRWRRRPHGRCTCFVGPGWVRSSHCCWIVIDAWRVAPCAATATNE